MAVAGGVVRARSDAVPEEAQSVTGHGQAALAARRAVQDATGQASRGSRAARMVSMPRHLVDDE